MQTARIRVVLAILLLLLAACSSTAPAPPAQAVTQTAPAVLALPALLAAPQQWSGQPVTLIAPLPAGADHRVLALPASSGSGQGLWLAQPLPGDVLAALTGETRFLKLQGTLSPPGAYGSQQQYVYQFTAERAAALKPEPTRIDNLALNPGALDNVLLRLQGTLLKRTDGALLVDRVSEGGVPEASGQQLKLAAGAVDQALAAELKTAGDVRWGAVEVIGWWQGGRLTPLTIMAPAPGAEAASEQATAGP